MRSEIMMRLQFSGFAITPDELSQELRISATESWLKGDQSQHAGVKKKSNGWVLDSGMSPASRFEEHITALLKRIRPNRTRFIEVAKSFPPVLSCVVRTYNGDRPYMGFESDMVKELAALNAEIDIDLYVL